MWWILFGVVSLVGALPCDEARMRCAYRVGCGRALQDYVIGCSGVLQGPIPTKCPEVCHNSLIALTSTEEGKELMNLFDRYPATVSEMAKKGQAVQLQAEVNNDEEWEKLLQRDGLINIYSEWCGPCSGMAATLKKLKLEIGGDLLHLALAKSDKITILERFRNQSEPTWMFIVNGKMVNFMFGANAPKLTRLIISELKREEQIRASGGTRVEMEISELTEEEKERVEALEEKQREAREKEQAKAAKELYERRKAEADNILESLNHLGAILVFPHAKTRYQEAFGDLISEAGLQISQTEKTILTQEILYELFFFTPNPFDEETTKHLLCESESVILLVKPKPGGGVSEDETVVLMLEIVYGPSRKAPGDPNSPAKLLMKPPPPEEGREVEEDQSEKISVWVPQDDETRATMIRLFFPKICVNYLIEPREPTPAHYAIIFEAERRQQILETMRKYPDEIIRYGFFTNEQPEEADLIAKTNKKYEKVLPLSAEARLVIELSKKKSECVLAFATLRPVYMSPNTIEGETECKLFFPEEYDEPIPEGEDELRIIEETKEDLFEGEEEAELESLSEVETEEMDEVEEEIEEEETELDDLALFGFIQAQPTDVTGEE